MIWALLPGLSASWASVLALTPRAFRSRTTGVEKEWGRGPRSEDAPQDENRRVIEWPGQRGWGVDLRCARQMTWTLGRNTAFDFWMCWSRRTTYIPEWKLRAPRVERDRSWADYKVCGLRISLAVQWLKLVQELRSHIPDSQKKKKPKTSGAQQGWQVPWGQKLPLLPHGISQHQAQRSSKWIFFINFIIMNGWSVRQ